MEAPLIDDFGGSVLNAIALSNITANVEELTFNQSQMPSSSPKCTSPGGADKMVSPGRVRTMKEYEEQMAELKKENFNLKLRIYFIEERQEQMKGLKGVDELFKKNVELSCELETLKKDLSEKEELLVQSAKAVEILQHQHKKQLEELKICTARDKSYLEDLIANLQKALREKDDAINQFDDSSAMYAVAFGYNKGPDQKLKQLAELREELNNVTMKVVQLDEELENERRRYSAIEEELEHVHEENSRLNGQISSLETEVEKRDTRLQQAYTDLECKAEQLAAISHRLSKKEKSSSLKSEQLCEREQRIAELEGKISEMERRTHLSTSGSRSSIDSTTGNSSSKDGTSRSRTRRSEERTLARQLQDVQSKLLHLEEQTRTMQARLHDTQHSCDRKDKDISQLRDEYHKACVTIQGLLKKNKLRDKEIASLQSEIGKKDRMLEEMKMESTPTFRSCHSSGNGTGVESLEQSDESVKDKLDFAQKKLEEISENHHEIVTEIEIQLKNLRLSLEEKETKLKEMEEKVFALTKSNYKDNRIAELESKLEEMKIKCDNDKYYELECVKENSAQRDILAKELENKVKENEQLRTELKKRTFNLQELVNKELWDKNKEIEKLNKLCERRQMEILQLKQQLCSTDKQVSYLQEKVKDMSNANFAMRDVQPARSDEGKENCTPFMFATDDVKLSQEQLMLILDERNFLSRKIEELKERLHNTPERDCDSRLVQTLRADLAKAKQETEVAERSRKEVVSAYSLLTNRLQELADFLDSLLPSLGAKKRRVVQHAVERSRELSRSFSAAADDTNSWQNLQPSLYAPLLPDFSTVDFWSGDDTTNPTLDEEATDENDVITQLRLQVETLTEEVKQRDIELERMQSQTVQPESLSSLSIWGLGNNSLEHCEEDENNIMKLVSMFESLDPNENNNIHAKNDLEKDKEMTTSFNSVDKNGNISLRNETKSSNIGEIIITSKKVPARCEQRDPPSVTGNISESEAWSEPDRSVSLARMGITDEVSMIQSWAHDDSSDTTDNGQKSSTGGKRIKYDSSELRRLQNRLRSLEEANEALRGELNILHQLAPPSLVSREDKATSICELTVDGIQTVPSSLLDEIRHQREKLETSLFYNDNIRKQLETIFASITFEDKDTTRLPQLKEAAEELANVKAISIDLENQCKALEQQCNDLEVALHSEKSECIKKNELCLELQREIEILKENKDECLQHVEALQKQVLELEAEMRLRSNEVSEKQSALIACRLTAQEQASVLEDNVKQAEALLREERDRWKRNEEEKQIELKTLEEDRNFLKGKVEHYEEEKSILSSQLEKYKSEDENNRKLLNELSNRLVECKDKEEKAISTKEEWKLKWERCQTEAEEAKARVSQVEEKMRELEKISSELEFGLRGQLEAASRQCLQAEARLNDMETKHKQREAEWRGRVMDVAEREVEWRRQLDAATLTTSEVVLERTRLANDKLRLQQEIRRRDTPHLERVKIELERRVAELEAANVELETRLSNLHVKKVPSDSENEEGGTVSTPTSPKHVPWSLDSPPFPLSPTRSKPHPSHQRYTSQRSNDISSDYMSDLDNCQTSTAIWPQRSVISASPDLGIESDPGRHSSLETNTQTVSIRIDGGANELVKLEEENVFLRQHLARTRHALENTLSQLTAANHKKRQVERAICQQIGKTHLILKKARVNLEADVDNC